MNPDTATEGLIARFRFLLVAMGVVFYGTGPVLARSTATTGPLLSLWRLWFGVGVFALAFGAQRLRGMGQINSRKGWTWAFVAGSTFAFNQVLFFTAVKRTSVADATLMSTMSPLVVAVIAVPIFGERPGRTFRLWSLVAIAGAAFVVLGSSSRSGGDFWGMAMALASTAMFSGFFLISKWARAEISVVAFLGGVMAAAAFWVTLYVLLITGEDVFAVSTTDRWRALAMAIVPGALGHVVMTAPLRYMPANIPPLMRLAGPVVSGGMAWVFLSEAATWVHLVGGLVILGGQAGAILSPAGQDLMASAKSSKS